MTSPVSLKALAAGALLALAAGHATAALITNRGSLGGNDHIDWAQLGSSFAGVATPSNVSSDLGLSAVVSSASGDFQRRDQGNGWAGNFAAGDALLWTNGTPGPMSLEFGAAVFGAGAQIQRNAYGGFTAVIAAYDALNNLLERYEVTGNSSSSGDNSAIFLGISRNTADIDRLEFSLLSRDDFAINRVELLSERGGQVPAPASLALVGAALIGLGIAKRRRAA